MMSGTGPEEGFWHATGDGKRRKTVRRRGMVDEGWCRQREKIDWQEHRKFDCRLVRTIFIFLNFLKTLARKSNFHS